MNSAYYLFRYKNIMPSAYFNMPFGEKQIVKAFISIEDGEIKEIMKNKDNTVFPVIKI